MPTGICAISCTVKSGDNPCIRKPAATRNRPAITQSFRLAMSARIPVGS